MMPWMNEFVKHVLFCLARGQYARRLVEISVPHQKQQVVGPALGKRWALNQGYNSAFTPVLCGSYKSKTAAVASAVEFAADLIRALRAAEGYPEV